ncbi:Protein trichome birefringence-like 19 [Raphanus sativus]|uniref:Protein trichome birefringence-like 19 n=2 Tax=Raphanus sativus TaxID=3726 RepID=A0A6J0KFQ9_RAPSA|nr:protein trichome birefringence-like 19 [Raphanus sativus]KAJ4882726.1 Protein trichome birefringence-like 19 [Raphanus sativus]
MELLHSAKSPSKQKLLILVTISISLFTIIPLLYPFVEDPNFFLKQQHPSQTSIVKLQDSVAATHKRCDIFSGEWVPNPEAPYYTNTTCWAIHEHQNCMRFGRPDTDFIKWKWRPHGCENDLPVFDPLRFLETVRGKTMAFVGDSVSRNHMQSLICLLSQVEYPVDASVNTSDYFKRWTYETYNFTIAPFWSTHLVKSIEPDPGKTEHSVFDLYLDEPDERWTAEIGDFDYVIISSGHWHFRPMVYYENNTIVGCRYCQLPNITDFSMFYGYRKAFRTAFKAILESETFEGVMYLRTFLPSHFEGGLWNEGGNCLRKGPYQGNETQDEVTRKLHRIQVEEFERAEKEAKRRGKRFRLLDTTRAMWLRPDGHPSRYGHLPEANVSLYNDCVHWCLPGPIDNLNDFLLAMIKREEEKGLLAQVRKMMS